MTRDDILVVEENAHLKVFVYELMRCIDEGIPVAHFFACSDKQSGDMDEPLLNAERYIADALSRRMFYCGTAECKFAVGQKVFKRNNVTDVYVIADFVNVFVEENAYGMGVALMRVGDTSPCRVYPVSYVNNNYELAE